MSLKHAILGLLTFHPMSGYTLKNDYFDESIANFWPADQAQIYRTLQSLEADDMVNCEIMENSSRPSQKIYSLTAKGWEELANWVASPQPLHKERYPLLVQLYFGRTIPKNKLVNVLQERRKLHEEKLAQLKAIVLPVFESEEMQKQVKFGSFTLEFGIRGEQFYIDWLNYVIAELESWD